jgi:hypothetical protein
MFARRSNPAFVEGLKGQSVEAGSAGILPALSGILLNSFSGVAGLMRENAGRFLRYAAHKAAGNMPAAVNNIPALPYGYAPRRKSNRYSSNKIMAPITDMIQPAT